jgi:two-component system response regulator MprA
MSVTLDRPILVVDDEPAIRTMVAEVLAMEGYPVLTAADGNEALQVIERGVPALLILDLWMPRLNGLALAHTLEERGIDIPIVVMTASNAADPWARSIGAKCYLQKPFDLSDLLAAIEEHCPDTNGAVA